MPQRKSDDDLELESQSQEERAQDAAGMFSVPQFLKEKVLGGILSVPQELERRIEDGIQRALELLDVPSRDELKQLHSQLDELLKRCEKLGDIHSEDESGDFDSLPKD